jgi:uncharacterized protein YegJ (DUF2314 family)
MLLTLSCAGNSSGPGTRISHPSVATTKVGSDHPLSFRVPTWTLTGEDAAMMGVMKVAADDPELAQARAEAKTLLPEFIAALSAPERGQIFSLKVALPTSDGSSEHIWLGQLEYAQGRFRGKVDNVPADHAIKEGAVVVVREDEVEDWSIAQLERKSNSLTIRGGFTERLLLARARGRAAPRSR